VKQARIATAWLGGCSGCHMSFLDMDEWLFELAEVADIVYSPIADIKVFPNDVDVTLVEGAVANEDNFELAREIRANSHLVISFGDCAVTGNVTGMRNPLGDPQKILESVYVDAPDRDGQIPNAAGIVPPLLPQVLPLHKIIRVDAFIPGCPPPADRIRNALEALLEGALPPNRGEAIRFG
jgi:NAD-reducing hydrogenase small subunit